MNLTIKNLTKHFGGNTALNNSTLTLKPECINLLIGANGSGKTTMTNCISGLLPADDGSVYFCDKNITNKPIHEIFQIGLIRTFQTPRLFANLSVFENIMLARNNPGESFWRALLYKTWQNQENNTAKKALDILEQLSLLNLKNKLAYDLSGGQIKLLEIGKTLMSDAKLVILDEPIAGINPTLAHTIFKQISNICTKQKTTFLIIEHRLDIALKYADHVFVLDGGTIIADDIPEKILQNKKVIESYLK